MLNLHWILKIDGCVYNPEKSSTTKIGKHIPCGYSMSTIWWFDHIEKFKINIKSCINFEKSL